VSLGVKVMPLEVLCGAYVGNRPVAEGGRVDREISVSELGDVEAPPRVNARAKASRTC